MPKSLIDDELWGRIEPLLPKRRPRNRRYAGRAPIPDRAALTGILFVLRSGLPWNMLPREMGCGSGTTCWRRLVKWQRAGVWKRLHTALLTELRRRGQLDLDRAVVDSASARCAGEENWTEPYRSPQGRVETSRSHRRARASDRRDPDRRQPERRHPAPAAGRCDAPARRASRSTGTEARPRARRPGLRLAAPPRPTPPPRHRVAARETPDTPRQRPRADALGRRTHPRVVASIPPPRRALRAAALHPRGLPGRFRAR